MPQLFVYYPIELNGIIIHFNIQLSIIYLNHRSKQNIILILALKMVQVLNGRQIHFEIVTYYDYWAGYIF